MTPPIQAIHSEFNPNLHSMYRVSSVVLTKELNALMRILSLGAVTELTQ